MAAGRISCGLHLAQEAEARGALARGHLGYGKRECRRTCQGQAQLPAAWLQGRRANSLGLRGSRRGPSLLSLCAAFVLPSLLLQEKRWLAYNKNIEAQLREQHLL